MSDKSSSRGSASFLDTSMLPRWLRITLAYCVAALVAALTVWLVLRVVLSVPLLTFSLVVALLLAALLFHLTGLLVRLKVPRWLAALLGVLLLLCVPVGSGFLLVSRASSQLDELQSGIAAGIDEIRGFLTGPPLSLEGQRVDQVRDLVVDRMYDAVPDPVTSAGMVLQLLAAAVLALFLLFFFLKDGPSMWQWGLSRTPAAHHDEVDAAGRTAWWTLSRYVAGTVVIALVDAVAIGAVLFVLGVPLALSLSLLIFLGAFIPIVGATISGAAAVLVTLVNLGLTEAFVVLGVVIVVQQVEGNLLQPVVMGRAVQLHPVVILVAVTAGGLLGGIAGAVVAVPLTAVAYQVADSLSASQGAGTATARARTKTANPD